MVKKKDVIQEMGILEETKDLMQNVLKDMDSQYSGDCEIMIELESSDYNRTMNNYPPIKINKYLFKKYLETEINDIRTKSNKLLNDLIKIED